MSAGSKTESHPETDRVLSGSGDDISWLPEPEPEPESETEKKKFSKRCGSAWDDDTRRNWTVFGIVPSVLFLVCFWDILVDPLQRMSRKRRRSEPDSPALVAFVLVFLIGFGYAGKSPLSYRRHSAKVCGSIDIRNNVSNFELLRNCEVIEGNLQIVLVTNSYCEKCNEMINNITFPELREVTGFVVLWRVQGLRSLSTLFPNLSVIRGRTLFENYALVAYEMKSLQEIGLISLTHILRGSVRFDKNPSLCFVDTIDWDWIAPNGASRHFLGDNRPKGECVKCPIVDVDNVKCPVSKTGEPLCWNKEHCQKDFRGCSKTSDGECCHESCLGGCTGPSSKDCFVCKDVVLGNECMQHCPENMYKYLDRRCVTEKECYNISRPLESKEIVSPYPFRPIEGSCLPECPANYAEMQRKWEGGTRFYCQPCKGRCKKECQGANIDSIASAQKFAGCTHISGSLEIQLRVGGNVVKELEESLSAVEEITGYLKIARSLPLISLDFLKNLRVIGGKELDNNKSAFVLLDNENLQELWDWSVREKEFKVLNGRLAFHFNPKLCFYKIEKFSEISGADFTEEEVPRGTNGDKEACNITTLKPYVAVNEPYSAIIKWKQFKHYDPRTLLGYAIYYIKAPYQNVTLYNGRDACGGDGWIIDDVAMPEEDNKDEMQYPMTQLKPFTQYAYFIKTYAIKSERNGAQSPIQYFTTHPATPTRPTNLYAYTNSSSEIIISWEPPTEINGNLSHYVVEGFGEPEVLEDEQRDYCSEPLVIATDKQPPPSLPTPPPKSEPEGCVCKTGKIGIKDSDDVRQGKIDFEDALQNSFFVRRTSSMEARTKRDLPNIEDNNQQQLLEVTSFEELMKLHAEQEEGRSVKQAFYREVKENRLVVRDLKYFTKYRVNVRACRALIEKENFTYPHCSLNNVFYVRTRKDDSADRIPDLILIRDSVNGTVEETRLKWEEPARPNGLILTYQIEYRRVDSDKYKPVQECITAQKFVEQKKEYVLNLPPGNYSVKVLASSLAGDGPYTAPRTFYIPQPGRSGASDVWAGVVGAAVVCAAVFGLFVFWKRKNSRVSKLFANVNPEYVSAAPVYVPDEWEVPRKNIELIRELGQGSFGMVYEGIARDIVKGKPEVRCAVKTVNEVATDRDRMEFLNEASVMKAFNTHHVVRLLGVVSEGQPTLVVMELMVNGDLKTYLRSHRPENCESTKKQPPTLKRILRMAIEIADGMAYLSAKKFVHRDLAARNCMVAEDLTVKIGDFGMTRDIYETDYYKKGTKGLLPVRWMAPESLKDGVFTSHSDVWSYGIVLWEMVTLASQPYQGLSNDQVLRYVVEGGVMDRPENCPDKLYDLMKKCWQFKPAARPHFVEFVTGLLPDASPEFPKNSYYHSPEGRELRAHLEAAEAEANFATPETPLRIARDIEDFSVGGSEPEMDEEEEEAELEVDPPFVSPRRGFLSSVTRPEIWYKNPTKPVTLASVSSSDSSRGSKVSNGSATTPTTLNGIIVGRSSEGTRNTSC